MTMFDILKDVLSKCKYKSELCIVKCVEQDYTYKVYFRSLKGTTTFEELNKTCGSYQHRSTCMECIGRAYSNILVMEGSYKKACDVLKYCFPYEFRSHYVK